MKKRFILAAIPVLLTTFSSLASSEAAWQQLDKDVQKSCLAISALQEKKIEGKRTDFGDDVGYSAVVISGNYKFKNSSPVPGKELCLYNRKSKKTSLAQMQ